MREIKVYNDWKEFLDDCDLSQWESDRDDKYVGCINISQFLAQPDIDYEEIEFQGESYIHIFKYGNYVECLIHNISSVLEFFLIYENGRCTGQVYFTEKEALETAFYRN